MHDAFRDLVSQTRAMLADLGSQWAAGEMSAQTFAEAMDEVLLSAHTRAVVIGRTHAGDDAPEDADDRRFAEGVIESEHEYLQPFRDQMLSGRYTGEDGTRDGDAVGRRAASYSTRLVGSANEALFLTLPEDTQVWWHTTAEEASCEDCPEMEDASPWLAGEMPYHVGMNQTACLVNCLCYEMTEAGLRGFSLP